MIVPMAPLGFPAAHHAEVCGGIKQRAKRLRVDPYTYWCLTLLMEDLGGLIDICVLMLHKLANAVVLAL